MTNSSKRWAPTRVAKTVRVATTPAKGPRPPPTGVPGVVGDNGAGEVGDDGGEGEEAVAVLAVAGGDLGEEGVLQLVLGGAAVAGEVAEVLMEEELHAEADVAVHGGDGGGGGEALGVAGEVLSPADGLVAALGVEGNDGGAEQGGETVGVPDVVVEEVVEGGLVVGLTVDEGETGDAEGFSLVCGGRGGSGASGERFGGCLGEDGAGEEEGDEEQTSGRRNGHERPRR